MTQGVCGWLTCDPISKLDKTATEIERNNNNEKTLDGSVSLFMTKKYRIYSNAILDLIPQKAQLPINTVLK